jgi:hypothetical protein
VTQRGEQRITISIDARADQVVLELSVDGYDKVQAYRRIEEVLTGVLVEVNERRKREEAACLPG